MVQMDYGAVLPPSQMVFFYIRSGVEEVDEREIFKGSENRLSMYQTYTHKFLCRYALQKYPFDEQVITMLFHILLC